MKYIFDVEKRNNKYEIKLEISKTGGYGANSYDIIERSEDNPNWTSDLETLVTNIIDSMRLTVHERMEARDNATILIDYLKNNIENLNNNSYKTPKMIVENGDPAVLTMKNN